MALIGRVDQYAAGPPRTTGRSTGCRPALSGMRASSTLSATLSGVMSARPPACPRPTTSTGCVARICRFNSVIAAPNTHGSSTPTTRCPPMTAPCNCRAISAEALIVSPPKGSKPASRMVFIFLGNVFKGCIGGPGALARRVSGRAAHASRSEGTPPTAAWIRCARDDRQGWFIRGQNQNRYTHRYMMSTLPRSTPSAIGVCARMTAFLSFNSSSIAGTRLKLAAIGVSSVPQ